MFTPKRLSGSEKFHSDGDELDLSLLSFWQWVASDLRSNATRGRLAEYLVARDIGVSHGVRREWLAHDLTTGDGIKVEVKSAAYVQGWTQSRPSQIVFDIRPTLGWDPDTAKFGETRRRQSDVYVFALLQEMDAQKLDPMNVKHWHFFVLATRTLDQSCPLQKTISLQELRALHPREVAFGAIANAISEATAMAKPRTEGAV